jgi:hypothetical protein
MRHAVCQPGGRADSGLYSRRRAFRSLGQFRAPALPARVASTDELYRIETMRPAAEDTEQRREMSRGRQVRGEEQGMSRKNWKRI